MLYVVNHAGGEHTIEVFDLSAGHLRKRTTLADPLVVSPNDVAAVGRDRLYITNDHGYPKGFMRAIEEFGQAGGLQRDLLRRLADSRWPRMASRTPTGSI